MSLELLRTIFSGCTLITVIVAVFNYYLAKNKAKEEAKLFKDKEMCNQAIIALERSYHVLTGNKADSSIPEKSRLNWLTTSRHLIRFEMLKSMLETKLYKLVCSEHEEHWRHQFYLCLNQKEILSPVYFQGSDFMPGSSENIDLKSALIVINFMQWNPDSQDPLDSVEKNKFLNDDYTLTGQHGLKNYIRILNNEKEQRNNS